MPMSSTPTNAGTKWGIHLRGELYEWDEASTYIQEPPFFNRTVSEVETDPEIKGARAMALLKRLCDHGPYLSRRRHRSQQSRRKIPEGARRATPDFNSYGSRRGNDRVMTRGTFANIRIRNQMVPGTEGGFTKHVPSGETMPIYDAAMKYKEENTPLVVLAGKEYGTGSSRDWAAKGTNLLGVKAVIAESFERIHRSNLVGMGVLPLQFEEGDSWQSLGLTGEETFDIEGLNDDVQPFQKVKVTATKADGSKVEFHGIVRLDSQVDIEYYRNGGILQTVLRQILNNQ